MGDFVTHAPQQKACSSKRHITRYGDPMHTPTLARIIVERAVLGAAVVPYRQRTNLPAESAGKFRLNGMRDQKIENWPCLGVLEPIERLRVITDVERFAAGLRMGPYKRMHGFRLQVARVANLGCHLLVAGVTAAVSRRTYFVGSAKFLAVPDIPGLDALEHLFHRIGQRVVSEVHVGKQRIATRIRRLLGVKDRRLCGFRIEHLVGVPDLPECSGVTLLLDDFEDLGMLVHAFHERVMVDFAETPSKGDLLLGREGLVAEKDHKMLEPGGLYFPERFIIQLTQVDAGDFSAERSCDRLGFDPPVGCHGLAPFVGGYCKRQANRSTAAY